MSDGSQPAPPQPAPLEYEASRRELARVADEVLPALIARFSAGGLAELEVRHGEWRARLRRAGPDGGSAATAGATTVRARDGRGTDAGRRAEPEGGPAGRSMVTSPAVGYFQPTDSLEVGRTLRTGDLVGHVDVLGVRHDVVAPANGVIGRIEVEPGEAVEYSQELARLDQLTDRSEPD